MGPQGNIGLHLVCHGKGPQRKWLHKIKKKDTPECQCGHQDQQREQSGEHLVERCGILAEARELVERSEMREWRARHSRNQPKEKERKRPVEPEKEKEEDKLERFFCHLYEFHNPVPNAPAFVPAELPPRYAIEFVPAAPAVFPIGSAPSTDVPVFPTGPTPSTDYSVISSVNFALVSSSSCIGPTQ